MKKSYIKLLILSFFTIFLCTFNAFFLKQFNTISLIIYLLLLLIITKITLGFEKDRHRYSKDISLEIIITLIIFFLTFYLCGLVIGFAKTNNYFTIKALTSIVISLIIYTILKEYLRYTLITKSSESLILMILMTITFIFIDNTIAFAISGLSFSKSTFLLIALTFIPSITENILCSWTTYHFGFKPCLIYLLIIKLYPYLLPIIPNPNEYIYSIIFFLLPVIILLRLKKWFTTDRVNENVERVRRKQFLPYIPLAIVVITLVYFVSGYFKYYAVAIATGSMVPNINKGDVVIVNQQFKADELEKGEIIAYKYGGRVIVHRINDLIKKDKTIIIYSKGDANNDVDGWKVTPDMIIGIVKNKIPAIGYPTIWLNERW